MINIEMMRRLKFEYTIILIETILAENPKNGGSPAKDNKFTKIIIFIFKLIFMILMSLIF